jgi:polysaccharide export outer membrane protein
MERMSMPLVEALTLAGGLDRARANDSGVLVFRNNASGGAVKASVFALDISSAGGFLLATQFPLRESDIVYVMPTALSKYNTVISQILPTAQLIWQVDQVIERSDL